MKTLLTFLAIAVAAQAVEPPITALAFSPDGKSALAGSQAGVQIRSWPELKIVGSLPTKLAHVHDLRFSPDGKILAIAGGSPAERGSVELFRWPEASLLHRVSSHKDLAHSVAWSADSKTIASASADQAVELLDVASGKSKARLEGHSRPVLAVAFLPGDRQLVSSGVDGTLRVWDLATGKAERELSYHSRPVHGLEVKPTEEKDTLAVLASISDDRTVRIWQPTIGRMVRFARLVSEPRSLAWNADGSLIYAACKDGTVRTIDPEAVEVRSTSRAIDGVAYVLAVAGDGSILVGGQGGQLKRLSVKK